MQTTRTLFVDSLYATEHDGTYNLNIPGGISIAEGARLFVDSISFTNTFSEAVDAKSDELYVKTLVNKGVLNPSSNTFAWSWQKEDGTVAEPTEQTMEGKYDLSSHKWLCDLGKVEWTDPFGVKVEFTQTAESVFSWVLPHSVNNAAGAGNEWDVSGSTETFVQGSDNLHYSYVNSNGNTRFIRFTQWDQEAPAQNELIWSHTENGTGTNMTWSVNKFTNADGSFALTPSSNFVLQGIYPASASETLFVQDHFSKVRSFIQALARTMCREHLQGTR